MTIIGLSPMLVPAGNSTPPPPPSGLPVSALTHCDYTDATKLNGGSISDGDRVSVAADASGNGVDWDILPTYAGCVYKTAGGQNGLSWGAFPQTSGQEVMRIADKTLLDGMSPVTNATIMEISVNRPDGAKFTTSSESGGLTKRSYVGVGNSKKLSMTTTAHGSQTISTQDLINGADTFRVIFWHFAGASSEVYVQNPEWIGNEALSESLPCDNNAYRVVGDDIYQMWTSPTSLGGIHEMAIFDKLLSVAEMNEIGAWIASKYAITWTDFPDT